MFLVCSGRVQQALKLFDFFSTLLSPEPWYYLPKWVVLDLLLLGSLYYFRIPRLQLQVQGWASILGVLGVLDVLLFGNYTVSMCHALHIFFVIVSKPR